jgi:hypothetical protein
MTSKPEEQTPSAGGTWPTVVEEDETPPPTFLGSSPQHLHGQDPEPEARSTFCLTGPRFLIDHSGAEVLAARDAPRDTRAAPGRREGQAGHGSGLPDQETRKKHAPLRRIRQELKLNSFCLPQLTPARTPQPQDLCDMAEIGFPNDNWLYDDDFTALTQPVELPKKKKHLPSDSVSTTAELESSRTTRSAFTMSQVDICQSASSSVSKKGRSGSVDICQSTSSSVYRLLDLGSRTTWSVFTMSKVDLCQSATSNVSKRGRGGSIDICQSTSSSVYRLLDLDSRHD